MGVTLLPTRLPKGVQDAIGRSVGGLGITPNMISMAGAAGNAAAAVLVARGSLLAAGIVYLVFSALDLVDGAVARATGKASPFGAVFDAVLDRASEAIVLAACAWHFAARGEHWQVAAAYAALLGSVAVSYLQRAGGGGRGADAGRAVPAAGAGGGAGDRAAAGLADGGDGHPRRAFEPDGAAARVDADAGAEGRRRALSGSIVGPGRARMRV
ncbi:CDP-alcohol phosphatidyltransferase family protein [Tepidiforma flava]|uniref:CDP-alcohol phosphatidyltransferase family protein n=1 Tax=Tepidiforma flava TaxID=3004094 RepID=A0ABY7M4S7_9CHLR|nr:CDP-alcohol phosphatidyltransferase family protein [Tepidiforma flava]WBL35370.1 CDP-alcohol phosphatidyltransferase family protein [Tepidiforma flava]